MFALRSDKEVNKFLDRQPSNSIDDATEFIKKIIDNNALYWAITLRDQDMLIGTICLFGFSDENCTCEIGYELSPQFQGKGILNEAAGEVIAYAFNTINVQRVLAFFHRENQRTIRSLERLSFSKSNITDNTNPELICYELVSPKSNLK